MIVRDFDFDLPEKSIGMYPWMKRTGNNYAKMMVVNRKDETIEHKDTSYLKDVLKSGDSVIYNDTKALGNAFEGFCQRTLNTGEVQTIPLQLVLTRMFKTKDIWNLEFLVFPSRKLRKGNTITIGELKLPIVDYTVNKGKLCSTRWSLTDIQNELAKHRIPLLPQYIRRFPEEGDFNVMDHHLAERVGSVLPCTDNLFIDRYIDLQLQILNIDFIPITHQINLGCFSDITSKDTKSFECDAQKSYISKESAAKFNATKGKKLAVGIDTLKTLEESTNYDRKLLPANRWISPLYIPGEKEFKSVDMLLTGFHIPQSQYLINVTAFMGYELAIKSYIQAIIHGYKFGIYGDAMLII